MNADLKIDSEFRGLIPSLTADEFSQLETNVLSDGCRDSLVVWENGELILIDGHNRYEICKKYDIDFSIRQKQFNSRDEAKLWIIQNQFGRRNLNSYQRSELALELESIFKRRAKENLITSTGGIKPQPLQKSANPAIDTREELAKIANVSHDTISKVRVIERNATSEQKEKLRSGEESINKVYCEIKQEERKSQGKDWYQSSESDDYWTPQALFDLLNSEFNFELDVCASEANYKCERYFSKEQDGLAQEWEGACWMNSPYGKEIIDWVRKAYESARQGALVVCLVPARTDTRWWWDYCIYGEVRFIRKRLKFGNSDNSAPFPSAVVIFRPGVLKQEQNVVWWDEWSSESNISAENKLR